MRIEFTGEPPVEADVIYRNVGHTHQLGLPFLRQEATHDRPLAVVGGGPSILGEIEALRAWPGNILAINGVCGWLRERDIPSAFFSVDPHPIVAQWAQGANAAILCSRCDPAVFEALRHAVVGIFDLARDNPEHSGIISGTSSATTALHIACLGGYQSITFFGCESSYTEATHAYLDEQRAEWMRVACGGEIYLTAPDFYVQAVELAPIIRQASPKIAERSGGLLRALIEQSDEHDIVEISEALAAKMTWETPLAVPLTDEVTTWLSQVTAQ